MRATIPDFLSINASRPVAIRQANLLYEIAKRFARQEGFPHTVTVAKHEKLLDLKPRELVNYRESLRLKRVERRPSGL